MKMNTKAQTDELNTPTLTNHLLEDLLNPSISALDLCNYHELTLPQLAEIISSEQFKLAKQTIEDISRARRELMEPESQTLALARMTDLLKDKPLTEKHAETARKAAQKLLACASSAQTLHCNSKEVHCSHTAEKPTAKKPGLIAPTKTPNTPHRSEPMKPTTIITLGAIAASTLTANAQSFNVEFGTNGTAPDATYAGVGEAGVWNSFDAMPNLQRFPLVGLDGNPIAADIMNIGFDVIEASNIASTTGNDEALLDDCFTSFNDPIDGCLFMRFLEPGEYRVIMYGIAPDDVSLLSRLRIDQNTEPPVMVGGDWSGAHEVGVTYMSQTATVTSTGRLDIHSGLPSGNIRSVCNGIQVIQLPPACAADLTGDGNLDFFDISAFLNAFTTMNPIADFTGDGSFDFFDVSAFLAAFSAGCP